MSSHAFEAGMRTYGDLGFNAGEFEARVAQAERNNARLRDSLHLNEFYLVLGIERNNDRAWNHFDRIYTKQMIGWAKALVRNEDDAQDVVQNVVLEIQKNRDLKYEGIGPLGAWLQRYVKNRAKDFLKRKIRRNAIVEDIVQKGGIETETAGDDVAHANCLRFITDCAKRGLSQTSETFRYVLTQLYYHGLQKQEVAKAVGWKNYKLSRQLPDCKAELEARIRAILKDTYNKVPADIEDCLHLLRSR